MGYSPWGHKELDTNEATKHSIAQQRTAESLPRGHCTLDSSLTQLRMAFLYI